MSIKDASLPIGATVAATGGTATNLVVLGGSLTETQAYVGTSGVTQLTRTTATFTVKQPKTSVSAPGGYTQGRSKVRIDVPKVLENLARTSNSISIELAFDPETTAAEVTALLQLASLHLIDTDLSSFWLNQSAS